MLTRLFKKSSFSGNGGCLGARRNVEGNVEVVDYKDLTKPAHTFTPREWQAFLDGAKAGEFDL